DKGHQQASICGDQWWWNCCSVSGFVRGDGGRSLRGSLLRLVAGGAEPCHVGRRGRDHRRRTSTRPGATGQRREDRTIACGNGIQLLGQRLPSRRGGQHRARARTGIHSAGVDLGRQGGEIQHRLQTAYPAAAALAASVAAYEPALAPSVLTNISWIAAA